ncbi:hypothetical protein THASP1DRAFT_19862, partial [Thamnocephalis sphaerospora]
TGGNTGIGFHTAQALLRAGHKVVLGKSCRNQERAKAAIKELVADETVYADQVHLLPLDLGSLASVREFAKQFRAQFGRLDVLVNNAGVMDIPYACTVDGFELQFAVNYLGPFLLTNLLLDLIRSSPAGRIVNVSSCAQFGVSEVDTRIAIDPKAYSRLGNYGASKLAMVMFTIALKERLAGTPATVSVLHPGVVATNLFDGNPIMRMGMGLLQTLRVARTPQQGAVTTVYLALHPDVSQTNSVYFVNEQPAAHHPAADVKAAREDLWRWSAQSVGLFSR